MNDILRNNDILVKHYSNKQENETSEMYNLRIEYSKKLKLIIPDITEINSLVIGLCFINKAKYGNIYNENIEKIIKYISERF